MEQEQIVDFSKNFSLLWPEEIDPEQYRDRDLLSNKTISDLGIKQIAEELSYDDRHYYEVRKMLNSLCDNPQVIKYRLDILEDFLNNPARLIEGFDEIFELIEQIKKYEKPESKMGNDKLVHTAWRLKMLDIYVQCMNKLTSLLEQTTNINSEGLKKLRDFINTLISSADFKNLQQELPELKEEFDKLTCVTIGINLNARLEPEEAVFLSVEPQPFQKKSFFSRLFNLDDKDDEFYGVSPLQNIISKDKEYKAVRQGLFRELNEIFTEVLTPIGKAISRYVNYREKFLLKMKKELYFYIGAGRTIKKLQKYGLKMCKPQTRTREARVANINDLTDLTLALGLIEEEEKRMERKGKDKSELTIDLSSRIVPNDLEFNDQARIYILTGPNQGGKTTFTRAAGIAQVLFQAGIYIPGSKAEMSPADRVYTHFTEQEVPDTRDGRLGKEARRLSRLFQEASRNSLILLNESLSSTSPGESLYLLKNIVKGLRILGCRVIFTTHLHELAENIPSINQEVKGDSRVKSLVAEVDRKNTGKQSFTARRTFKIVPKPPEGKSYARDIAQKYGIGFEQILECLDQKDSNNSSDKINQE